MGFAVLSGLERYRAFSNNIHRRDHIARDSLADFRLDVFLSCGLASQSGAILNISEDFPIIFLIIFIHCRSLL